MAFGHSVGSHGMTWFSDELRFIRSQRGHLLMNYIDDQLLARLSQSLYGILNELCKLLEELNVPISESKLTHLL